VEDVDVEAKELENGLLYFASANFFGEFREIEIAFADVDCAEPDCSALVSCDFFRDFCVQNAFRHISNSVFCGIFLLFDVFGDKILD